MEKSRFAAMSSNPRVSTIVLLSDIVNEGGEDGIALRDSCMEAN